MYKNLIRTSFTSLVVSAVVLTVSFFAVAQTAKAAMVNPNAAPATVGSTLEMHINNDGSVLARGAQITSISGSTIDATQNWNAYSISWIINTGTSTDLSLRYGAPAVLSNFSIGDYISFSGTLDNSKSAATVNANVVKDFSAQKASSNFSGTVASVNSSNTSFVLKTSTNGNVTIMVSPSTTIKFGSVTVPFLSIAVGQQITRTDGVFNNLSNSLQAQDVYIYSAPAVTLTSPSGGTYAPGATLPITWTTQGAVNLVNISLVNGSATTTLGNVGATSGSYTWNIPKSQAIGSAYEIYIQPNGGGTGSYSAPFTIGYTANAPQVSAVTVTPAAGDTAINAGDVVTVAWTSQNIANLKLALYQNGVLVSAIGTTPASQTSLSWTVPRITGSYTVRVEDSANVSIFADSAAFTVLPHGVTLTSPSGGTYAPGATLPITWTTQGAVNLVNISLVNGSATTTLGNVGATSGSYTWNIPKSQAIGSAYEIYIQPNGGGTGSYSAPFTIGYTANPLSVNATLSATGDKLQINWTVQNAITSDIKIDLLTSAGAVAATIKPSVAATTGGVGVSYTIPKTVSNGTYMVRITSVTNASVFADSATFTVSDHAAAAASALSQTASAATASELSSLYAQLQAILQALSGLSH